VIISNEEILSRTTEIAAEIKKKCLGSCKNLELICVLNGSCIVSNFVQSFARNISLINNATVLSLFAHSVGKRESEVWI